MNPRMFYFGPWDRAGHYLFSEHGNQVYKEKDLRNFPWGEGCIDGCLQPGCHKDPRNGRWGHHGPQNEGQALLHHRDGWTALSFWDRTIDKRFGCNSTYFAEGTFTFEQMVEMASTRFTVRWNRMAFKVVKSPQ